MGETKEKMKLKKDPNSVKRKLDVRDEKKAQSSVKKKLEAAINLDKSFNEDDVEYEELRCLRAHIKPGATVHSDEFSTNFNLTEIGYNHNTVNYSQDICIECHQTCHRCIDNFSTFF